jgi:hypothetical protein
MSVLAVILALLALLFLTNVAMGAIWLIVWLGRMGWWRVMSPPASSRP